MSEVLRLQPDTSEKLPDQNRNRATIGLAEVAILGFLNPLELPKLATQLAIDPELELEKIKEEELALRAQDSIAKSNE